MRKIITISATALLILSACAKQQAATPVQAITFGAYSERAVSTKASLPSGPEEFTAYDVKKGYYVQAWYKNAEYFQDKFKNDAAKSTSKGKTYYWPVDLSTNKMSFYAAARSNDDAVEIKSDHKVEFSTSNDGWTEELVVAKAENIASPGTVQLSLGHALSKISNVTFKAKSSDPSATADYTYSLLLDVNAGGSPCVGFKGYTKATYNLALSTWTLPESGEKYWYQYDGGSFKGNGSIDVANLPDDKKIRALIPQTFDVSVSYEIKYGGSDGVVVFGPVTKTGSIALEQGKAYSISIELSNDNAPIVFTAVASPWTSEEKTVTISTGE